MGTIKDRNGMDLTEGEDIKNRWQEYTEELYKQDLHDPDNHDGVITHLEPDILECKVKWALGSIATNKANRGEKIPAKLFQILKDDAVKVLPSIWQLLLLLLSRFSHVQLFATPWTAACKAYPPMGLSRQGYWSGLPLPSPTSM